MNRKTENRLPSPSRASSVLTVGMILASIEYSILSSMEIKFDDQRGIGVLRGVVRGVAMGDAIRLSVVGLITPLIAFTGLTLG